jgi:acyl dehydratase
MRPIRLARTLEPVIVGPITAEKVRAFAEVSGDHNPIHLDVAAARRIGLSHPPVHGMQLVALMHAAAAGHAPQGEVVSLSTRFLAPVPVGETVEISGRIVKLDEDAEPASAVMRLFLRTQSGLVASVGEATIVMARCDAPVP